MAVCERRMLLAIPAVIMALGLAACTTSGSPPPPAGAAASPASAPAEEPSFGRKVENILLLGTANPPPLKPGGTDDNDKVYCPEIDIQPGTASWQVADGGNGADPFAVRYQARFGKLARDCNVTGSNVVVRVGFSGRVLVGPKGQAGTTVTLPVRIALVDNDGKPVFSRLEPVQVAIPAGSGGADFSRVVESQALPVPPDRMVGWRIALGFDSKTAAAKPSRRLRLRQSHTP